MKDANARDDFETQQERGDVVGEISAARREVHSRWSATDAAQSDRPVGGPQVTKQ